MKDVIVVVPTVLAGAVMLINATEASWRRPEDVPTYLLFLAFLFVVLLLWYRSKLKAAERARAPEQRPTPAKVLEPWTPARAVVAVGVGVPVGVCMMAWLTCLTTRPHEAGVVWGIAGLLGVTALLCGTFLLTRLPGSPFATAARAHRNGWPKPEVHDPDAIDIVGRRG
jgi:hypothetical protein